jgi:catechol 2,3-dioxygenase-like lactoylglutathione lyase family enzyme
MKSVAGVICLVKDLEKSAAFYEALGFEFKKNIPGVSMTAYLNWFWIELLFEDKIVTKEFKEDVKVTRKGAGQYIHISVENVDDYYNKLLKKGIKPLSKPQDYPWGSREFVVRDPDGYKLVLFKKN